MSRYRKEAWADRSMFNDFTEKEIRYAVNGLKEESAPGPDLITALVYKKLEVSHKYLASAFSAMVATGTIHSYLKNMVVVPLGKPKKPRNLFFGKKSG